MGTGYFVEVLGRSGGAVYRQAVTSFPFKVGRGYDADLFLDDPYVDPLHIAFDLDTEAQVRVSDHGTRNGTMLVSRGKPSPVGEGLPVGPEDKIRIGRTLLRIRPDTYAVPAALPLPAERRTSPVLALGAYVLMLILVIGMTWFRLPEIMENKIPGIALIATTAVLAWCGGLALVGMFLIRRVVFVRHVLIACSGVALLYLGWYLWEICTFAFGLNRLPIFWTVITAAITGATLFMHLKLLTRVDRKVLLGITLSVATIVTLSPDLIEKIKEKDDQSRDIRQTQVSFHPALLVTSGVSIDEFVDLIGPARKDAEGLAKK